MQGYKSIDISKKIIVLITLLGALVGCVLGEGVSCSDSSVARWFDETNYVGENFDYSLESSKSSYEAQQRIGTPECLEKLQELQVSFYFYSWKAEEEHQLGNDDLAKSYANKAMDAMDKMQMEIDRIGIEFGWNELVIKPTDHPTTVTPKPTETLKPVPTFTRTAPPSSLYYKDKDRSNWARSWCRNAVYSKLNFPSNSKFGGWDNVGKVEGYEERYFHNGHIEFSNENGDTVRKNFSCVIDYVNEDWKIINLEIN
jgi:hypothetical protein